MDSILACKRIIKQVKAILNKKQKREVVVVFISMIVCSVLELLGVTIIFPFLEVITDEERSSNKWYMSWIYDIWPGITVSECVLVFGILMIIIYILKNALALYCSYLQSKFSSDFQKDASVKMLMSYMKRPYEYFVNTNSNEIFRGITNDTSSVYQVMLNILQIMAEMITIILIGVYLIIKDWFVAFCAMVLAAVAFLIVTFGFKNRLKTIGKENRKAIYLQNDSMHQAINGIKEVMVLDRKKEFTSKFEDYAEILKDTNRIKSFIEACPDRILEAACICGFMGIICIKVLLGTDMASFVPVLGAFAMGAFKVIPSVSKISGRINGIVYFQFGLQNCYDQMREAEEIDAEYQCAEEELKEKLFEIAKTRDIDSISFQKELCINDIYWHYKNSEENVLSGLSLTIHKGESIAFVGTSGAGKSTLADVIMGLLKPQRGSVTMDGLDIFSIPHQWSRIIGYVPQSVYLIDDTVRSNVAFGLKGDVVTDEKIWKALEQAQLAEFVRNLPEGLDTIVGERGVKFSGGQRQRIAIARALYENPDILVFDEATSALDTETETAVMESIDALRGVKTLIIIAHRLSTISNCDIVYEIGNGVAVMKDGGNK